MHRAWMPTIDISVIGAKSRHLKLKAVLQHDDHTEMCADRVCARENRLYRFWARVSGDVVILRRQSSHHVANATACEIRDMPCSRKRAATLRAVVSMGEDFIRPL